MKRCAPEFASWIVSIVVVTMLGGCMTLAFTALGVGGTTAVSHTLSGISYKTFTAPLPEVRTASIIALQRMGIRLESARKAEGNDVLRALGRDRDIEIVLEPISLNATRMRVIARSSGLFFDSATSTEIIMQTERMLGQQVAPGASPQAKTPA
ncbi:MAG: hypothetical protein ACXWCS_11465 [Burkholderiales bacterium]